MSKGSQPRPFEIPQEEYASNHARIFGAPKARERYIPPPLETEDDIVADIMRTCDRIAEANEGHFYSPYARLRKSGERS